MKVSDYMAKVKNNNPRVHEISKYINVSSKDLIALLESYGVTVKNHMTVLENREIDIILTTYLNKYDRGDTIEEYYASVKAEKQAEAKANGKSADKAQEAAPAEIEAEITEESLEIKTEPVRTVVDTRQNNVDLEKLDTEKIEQLVDVDKVEGKQAKKQKIKKGGQAKKQEKENFFWSSAARAISLAIKFRQAAR